MGDTRTHVILPSAILSEIDALVGKRGRSAFLAEVAEEAIRRRKLLSILERTDEIWKTKDHPELKRGAAAWVSKMRRADERARARRSR
jgi:hypothetical protein